MTARLLLLALSVLIGGGTTHAFAQPVPPASGIWQGSAAHALRNESRQALVTSLTRITGIERLAFSPEGRFEIGDSARSTRGSRIAENILRRAVGSDAVFVVQEHSGSPAVAFGQIEGMTYINDHTGRRVQIWWVRIDFDDFRAIQGPKRVRAAFDPGFVLLHELLHAFGHHDDDAPGGLGECERILNMARGELNLPLRADYAATRIAQTDRGSDARLRFEEGLRGGRPAQVRHLFFSTHATGERSAATGHAPVPRARAVAKPARSTFASYTDPLRTEMNGPFSERRPPRLEARHPAGDGPSTTAAGGRTGGRDLND